MALTQLIRDDELPSRMGVVSDDIAAKLSTGAALVYAIYYHPGAAEMLKQFNDAATRAYGDACKAYGLSGH